MDLYPARGVLSMFARIAACMDEDQALFQMPGMSSPHAHRPSKGSPWTL
jgi:hypothetical protein